MGRGSLGHILLLQVSSHLVPLLLQESSHLVPLLLQESSHLVPLLLQETSLHFLSFFVKTFLVYFSIVSAARSLTCRDDLDSKWRLLLAEKELSCVSLLSSISIGN